MTQSKTILLVRTSWSLREWKNGKHDWWRKAHWNVSGSWSGPLQTERREWHLQSIIYLNYQMLHHCQISAINIYGWSTGWCIRNTTVWANHLPWQEKKGTYLIGYTVLYKMIQNSIKMRQVIGKWGNRVCSLNITVLQICITDLARDIIILHPSDYVQMTLLFKLSVAPLINSNKQYSWLVCKVVTPY